MWVYNGLTSAIKVRHYSPNTLQVYKFWTQKFQTFTSDVRTTMIYTHTVRSVTLKAAKSPLDF